VQVRRPYVLFFALVVAVVVGGLWWGRRGQHVDVLAAVPADAWLVVTIDVAALRASPLAAPLLGKGQDAGPRPAADSAIPGLGTLADACGFDPLTRIGQVVVCSPEGGERGDFGVAFTGEVTRDELQQCADRIARARGGQPRTSRRGAFYVLEDQADAAHTRFAYREGGPFLVGRGPWLDAMIDAAEGKAPRERPEHATLRQALASKPGEAPRVAYVTAVLPAGVRQKLRAQLGDELGSEGERRYASVLAVGEVGLALGTSGPGSTTDLAAELRCDTADACAEVKTLLEHERLVVSRDLALRLVGIGPLVDSLTISTAGSGLSATAHAATDDLARAVQRVLDFRAPRRPAPSPSALPDAGAPPATPFDSGASKD
jgi:hypothetical protein